MRSLSIVFSLSILLFANAAYSESQESKKKTSSPTNIVDVIEAEFDALMFEDSVFSDAFGEERFPQIPAYLSNTHVGEMITVVKNETGEIVVDILPALAQESLRGNEMEGYFLLQELKQRLQTRFEYEGY